jgi:hypothetical protein
VDRGKEAFSFEFLGEEADVLFLRKRLSQLDTVALISVGEFGFFAVV